MIDIKDLKTNIINNGLFNEDFPVSGCSDEQIERMKIGQGVEQLPELYIQFAKCMGNGAGLLFDYITATCNYLENIKPRIEEYFHNSFERFEFGLAPDVFIIHANREGFVFFHTNLDNDNPAVYQFHTLLSENPRKLGTLTEHLEHHYFEAKVELERKENLAQKTKELSKKMLIRIQGDSK